jgi:hypothetical protein
MKFIKSKTEKRTGIIKKIISGYWKETNRDIFTLDKNLPKQRTGFWLVDYDEKTKHWNDHHHNFIDDETIKKKITLLKKKIKQMEKKYSK